MQPGIRAVAEEKARGFSDEIRAQSPGSASAVAADAPVTELATDLLRVHSLPEAQGTHVDPNRINIRGALGLRTFFIDGFPAGRYFFPLRPQRVLFLIVDEHDVGIVVFRLVCHTTFLFVTAETWKPRIDRIYHNDFAEFKTLLKSDIGQYNERSLEDSLP
jgi:hypothetical protein